MELADIGFVKSQGRCVLRQHVCGRVGVGMEVHACVFVCVCVSVSSFQEVVHLVVKTKLFDMYVYIIAYICGSIVIYSIIHLYTICLHVSSK